jgi:hypothetical protein
MKQDNAPKTKEVIKEELATAADITSATAEIQEGALEDTAEMNKDETDEEDVVKSWLVNISAPIAPCKSFFNVEKVRTKSQRKPNSQLLKNWRLKGLMLMLLLQVNVVRERINMTAREDRLNKDTVRHGDDEDVNVVDENNAEKRSSQSRPSMGEPAIKSVGDAASENTIDEEPGMEAVMVDISDVVDVVMCNTEYEADIIDEANVVRERVGRTGSTKTLPGMMMMRTRTTRRYSAASQEQPWVSQ